MHASMSVCVCMCVNRGAFICKWAACVQTCIRRRDPYHGVMRSATAGYPHTLVIMDTVGEGPTPT